LDGVTVGVLLGVSVGVKVGVMVGVGVKITSKQTGAESTRSNGLRVFPFSSYIFTNFTSGNCLTVSDNGCEILYVVPFGWHCPFK
jgi:hypothetical protein